MGSLLAKQFSVKDLQGLSLWLKADAGVSREPFNYVSQIILSNSSFPNVNGTYIATSVPSFDINDNRINAYSLTSTNGNTINWVIGDDTFQLSPNGSATNLQCWSYDGVNWFVYNGGGVGNPLVFSGITGTYSDANTEMFGGESYWSDGNYYVSGSQYNWNLFTYGEEGDILIATNSNQYPNGTWTNVLTTGTVTSTVPIETADMTGSTTISVAYKPIVTGWADQSGNGNNATPVADNPIYNISDLNSKPTISLTSMSDYVERVFSISINPLGAAGSTAFSVQYVEDVCNAFNDNGPIFGNFGGSEDTESRSQTHYPYGQNCYVYDSFATTLRKNEITPPVTITNAWTLYSVKSTNNDWQSFVNGQLMYSDPTNTYSNTIGGDNTTLYIGKQTANGTFPLKGKVAEVIVYNRVLTTSERQKVEAYLNAKYAIYSPIKNTKILIKKQNLGSGKLNLLLRGYAYKATGAGLSPNINNLRFYDSGLIYNSKKSFYSEDGQYAIWYWGGFPINIMLIGSIANIGTFDTNGWGKIGATNTVAGSYIAAGDKIGIVTISAI
jgi:hypothetical protein